eukprot:TRINITY_DN36856_c0_g2_i1.p1 TRINITY_DN36856_c0_g2~~TRINITY_DN36856_c0_g2_i1.p1  ORF type:complete len:652 (-),score=46.81 TRINITY_DN36856_c0_g2_i1:233-2188(-)
MYSIYFIFLLHAAFTHIAVVSILGQAELQSIDWDLIYDQSIQQDILIQQQIQQTMPRVNRTTVDGYPCILPFTFRGHVWDDCFIVEGKPMCIAEKVGLQECVPEVGKDSELEANETEYDTESNLINLRMTMTGEACEFPFEFGGELYDDCVDIVGSKMCIANGMLQECKPLPNYNHRTTIDGNACIFPFTVLGTQHYDCAFINGIEACMVDNGLAECAPLNSTISLKSAKTRMTTDGRECKFPYQFMDSEYYDCNEFLGEEWCLIDMTWAKCIPMSNGLDQQAHFDGSDAQVNEDMIGSVISQISIQPSSKGFISIADAISNILELSTMLQFAHLTNLIPFLSNDSLEVTFFAPTNEAFAAYLLSQNIRTEDLINNPDILYKLFMFHLIPGQVRFEEFQHGQLLNTLLDDYQLSVDLNLSVKVVGINSVAHIEKSNIKAGQAVIHTIDEVLMPFNMSPDSILSKEPILSVNKNLNKEVIAEYKQQEKSKDIGLEDVSMFMELAELSNIDRIGSGDLDGTTLLAPTNTAFKASLQTHNITYEQLMQDTKQLNTILRYHTIDQLIEDADLSRKLLLRTLYNNKMLLVERNLETHSTSIRGKGSVAKVISDAMHAGQGIIYALDAVLWPYNTPAKHEFGKQQDKIMTLKEMLNS